MRIDPKFKGLIDLKNAALKYDRAESTLKKHIHNGVFEIGVDVVKFGNSWVFNEKALQSITQQLIINWITM